MPIPSYRKLMRAAGQKIFLFARKGIIQQWNIYQGHYNILFYLQGCLNIITGKGTL